MRAKDKFKKGELHESDACRLPETPGTIPETPDNPDSKVVKDRSNPKEKRLYRLDRVSYFYFH